MSILLVIPGIICLLVELAGCFLPISSRPSMAYLALRLLYFTDYAESMVMELVVWGLLVMLAQVMNYITSMLGARYNGGFKWGNRGYVMGTVASIPVFPPWGILLGPFARAFIGELLGGKTSGDALETGLGAFTDFLLSVVLKVALCGYFIYSSVRGMINWRW